MSRYPALDGLRAAAIILVILFHTGGNLLGPLKPLLQTGWNGVYLFFVLSGFLVGSLAFNELVATGRLQLGRFWTRRFLRTWPLYYVLLAFNASRVETISPSLWHYITFTQNYYKLDFFIPTWSLAIEEQYYFTFPILVVSLLKRGVSISRLHYLFSFFILLAPALRALKSPAHTLNHIDSISMGCLIAWAWKFRRPLVERCLPWANGLFALGLFFAYSPFLLGEGEAKDVLLFSGQAIGFGLILLSALSERLWCRALLASRGAYWAALFSYGTYLIHDKSIFHLSRWIRSLGLQPWCNDFLLLLSCVPASLACGAALYYSVERLGLDFRDRYFPRLAGTK